MKATILFGFIVLNCIQFVFSIDIDDLIFLEFPTPDTLTVEEIREDIEERRAFFQERALLNRIDSFVAVPLYIENGISFNFANAVQPTLDELDTIQDPDFLMLTLVQILFQTEEFNDEILQAISRVKLWLTVGEQLRIYWTENHMIMYTTIAYLLRQKFGVEAFESDFFDPNLDVRLDWYLDTKPITGFFEYYSPIYYQFSTAALMLLHDLATDVSVKERAKASIERLLIDTLKITTSEGIVTAASGRSNQFFSYQENNMFGNGLQQIMGILTGLGPIATESLNLRVVSVIFLLSDIDLSETIATYELSNTLEREIGVTIDENEAIFGSLPENEKEIAQLTMGTYAHQDYVQDLVNVANHFNIAANPDFAPFAQLLTNDNPVSLSKLAEPITSGSLHSIEKYSIYKNRAVSLTSLQNYFPGFKGYEQLPSMAVIKNTTVWSYSLPENNILDSSTSGGRSQIANNNQLPLFVQKNNVLLSLYNPNRLLSVLGATDLEIVFYFDSGHYDEVTQSEAITDENNVIGQWLFGRVDDSYVGIYRIQCIEEVEIIHTICKEEKQLYLTVVGNEQVYESFNNFIETLEQSEIKQVISDNCIKFEGIVDGNEFDEIFCQGRVDIIDEDDDDGPEGDNEDNAGDGFNFDKLTDGFLPIVVAGIGLFVVFTIIVVVAIVVSSNKSKSKRKNVLERPETNKVNELDDLENRAQ